MAGAAIFLIAGLITTQSVSVSSAADSGIEKLKWHEEPRPAPDVVFLDGDGDEISLADFQGKVVVVNLWATWCAPCIREMPTLDALQENLGGDDFQVIALSQDREGARVAEPFIETNGWAHLDLYVEPKTQFSRSAEVRGLPTTLIIDRAGQEVARLEGTAEWNAPEVVEVLEGLIAGQKP